jgi:hypothetical protein
MAPAHPRQVVRRLLAGDEQAVAAIAAADRTSDDPVVLVAAALFTADGDGDRLLARAAATAATTRDRQLVAIATAHRHGERELVDALARDHLVDHPDSVLVAWIAHLSRHETSTRKEGACAPDSPRSC